MIAEVIPAAYDADGKNVFRPFGRRRGLRPTFPLGRYVSQPLTIHCHSIEEIRQFLRGCKSVSDKELFENQITKNDIKKLLPSFEELGIYNFLGNYGNVLLRNKNLS